MVRRQEKWSRVEAAASKEAVWGLETARTQSFGGREWEQEGK